MNNRTMIVTPWHNERQLQKFLEAWGIWNKALPDFLHLEQDKTKKGCALTKNAGIKAAIKKGAETIIILDDDCLPTFDENLEEFAEDHEYCLEPQRVKLFDQVTTPPSRGTPYFARDVEQMPVAASMGFWTEVGDFDAPAQLVLGQTHQMSFDQRCIYGRYFPLCGMNLAFRVEEFPWCQFIDVERFDDIWQGFLWQRKAWAAGQCFNLNGPLVRHSRQSNVWHNIRVEAPNLERNETIWQKAATMPFTNYETMKKNLIS